MGENPGRRQGVGSKKVQKNPKNKKHNETTKKKKTHKKQKQKTKPTQNPKQARYKNENKNLKEEEATHLHTTVLGSYR